MAVGHCKRVSRPLSSGLLSAMVIANVWLSGSRAFSHEPHRTKQMHLFSQLEEFANVRTRVNSLANLHQTQLVVPAEALLRSLLNLAWTALLSTALQFAITNPVLFSGPHTSDINQCCQSSLFKMNMPSNSFLISTGFS